MQRRRSMGIVGGSWVYGACVLILALLQLAWGSQLFLTVTLAAISLAAIWPATRRQMLLSDGLYLLLCIYYGTAALALKCLALQPLQANLRNDGVSTAVLAVGFLSISVGYYLCSLVRRPGKYAGQMKTILMDGNFRSRFSVPIFAVGFFFYFLQTQFRAVSVEGSFEAGGFGGFGIFYPLLLLGLSMQVTSVIARPRALSPKLVLGAMLVLVFFLSLADNTKKTLVDAVVILVAAYFAFGVRLRLRWLILAGIGAFLMIGYVQPVIQIVRSDINARSIDRIGATIDVLQQNDFDMFRLASEADRVAQGYKITYQGSYVYPLAWNTERFTMIQPIDQVAQHFEQRGTMGGRDIVRDLLETLLPGALIDKTLVTMPDRIAWFYGFRRYGTISRPVVGLIASSLATYGYVGVIILPGLLIAFTCSILNFFGGYFRRNAWAVFLFASSTALAEKEVSTMLTFFCRTFPFILLVGVGILFVGAGALQRRRSRLRRAAPVADG